MLRADLLAAPACRSHRLGSHFRYAADWPACPDCQRILTQVATSCSHNREELQSFVVELGKLVDRRIQAC